MRPLTRIQSAGSDRQQAAFRALNGWGEVQAFRRHRRTMVAGCVSSGKSRLFSGALGSAERPTAAHPAKRPPSGCEKTDYSATIHRSAIFACPYGTRFPLGWRIISGGDESAGFEDPPGHPAYAPTRIPHHPG